MRRIIVTADDFGLCPETNEAICLLSDQGIVRRTTFLANTEHFDASVAALRRRPALDIGIHLNLTDGRPVLPAADVPTLVTRRGAFRGGRHYAVLARIAAGVMSLRQIHAEWRAQIARARSAGLAVRHLSSHGHLHLMPRLHNVVADLVDEFAIPDVRVVRSGDAVRGLVLGFASGRLVRTMRERHLQVNVPDRILGLAHQGSLTAPRLVDAIAKTGDGISELIVHPSAGGNEYHRRWHFDGPGETNALLSREVAALLRATC